MPSMMTRRHLLQASLAAALSAVVAACSRKVTPRATSTNTPTPTTTATGTAVPTCIVKPALTEGPYFVDEKLNRSDIREDRQGALLRLAFNVSRLDASGCVALQGAQVDVWHCDAAGVYSDVAQNAAAYGIEASQVDGMDVLAVRDAVGKAVEQVRTSRRPYFLEAVTYRFLGHSMADPAHGHYRTKSEVDEAKKRDPLLLLRTRMLSERLATEVDLKRIEQEVAQAVREAVEFADASPVPPVTALEDDVYA